MTLFLACIFAALSAVFGFATWMYYHTVENLLEELLLLDDENDLLVGHLVSQQEAMALAQVQTAKVFRADGSIQHFN